MFSRLEIQVQDLGATALMQQIKAKMGNPRPVMLDFGERMKGSERRTFEVEGRPRRWAALKPSTLRAKIHKFGGPGKILQATTLMMNSINAQVFGNRLEINAPRKYASFQQEGTRKMVARPFLLVQAEDWSYFINRWTAYLEGK